MPQPGTGPSGSNGDEPDIGISSTELAVCKSLLAQEQATIGEPVSRLPRDRSTVTRRLDHLVELGVIEKESRPIERGGRENVYSPTAPDDVHRILRLGLYA